MTTEMKFIHLLRRSFPTPFRLLILCTALLQKMRARGKRDGTNCAKNSTFNGYDIFFDSANRISGKKVPSYGLLPRFIYISPGRVRKRYFEPFFSTQVIHVITNLGVGYDLFMKYLRTKPDLATHRLQYVTYVNRGSGTQKEVHFISLGEGAGGYAIRLCFNPLPLYIPFLTKGTPFVYLPLIICTLFTYLIHENKLVIKEVFRLFS